jgi:replicative DNA helicase
MDEFSERKLPNNEHAEASLLGCLLQNGDRFILLDEVGLSPDEFYSQRHKLIFSAIVSIANAGKETLDIVTVHDYLVTTGNSEKVGEWSYLSELVDNAPIVDADQVVAYARLVKNSFLHRHFISQCETAAAQARKDQSQFDDLLDGMTTNLINLANASSKTDVQLLQPLVISVVEDMVERMGGDGNSLLGIASGFPSLDKLSSGLKKGDMVVIAARPGLGKTSLVINMSCRVAEKGHSVLFFTLEMPAEQVAKRILAAETGVDMTKIFNASLSGEELTQIMSNIDNAGKLPIYIDDSSHLTVASLRSKVKSLKATLSKDNKTLDLIVVDYIGLMHAPSHMMAEKKNAQVEEISRGLKLFAKDIETPIIVLSQLNRQVEGRKEKVPVLSDLRDSGAIEQDADLVAMISRNTDVSAGEDGSKAELHVLKNRHGATGVISLHFHGPTTKFRELSEIDYHHSN